MIDSYIPTSYTRVESLILGRNLSKDTMASLERFETKLPWKVTDYYLSLFNIECNSDPLQKQVIPSENELSDSSGSDDPLNELGNSPVKNLIHVYPNRVAIIITDECFTYCRYCLRRRLVGCGKGVMSKENFDEVVSFIASNRCIEDVLLTGGDPLTMPDEALEIYLSRLSRIEHIRILRIGTRSLVNCPSRITQKLAKMLTKFNPIFVNTQFNHPREITSDAVHAVQTLVNNGIMVNNQSVLLKGVNDDYFTLKELCMKLLECRVRPYYVYQAQSLKQTSHFIVEIERGIGLFDQLRGNISGLALPTYVLDTPFGKCPLNNSSFIGRQGDYIGVRSFSGQKWLEYNPQKIAI